MSRHRSNTEAAMFPQKCSSARLTKSACVLAELSAVAPVAIAGLAVADPLDASKADYEQCLANDFPHETCCSRQDGRNPRAIHPNMRLFLNQISNCFGYAAGLSSFTGCTGVNSIWLRPRRRQGRAYSRKSGLQLLRASRARYRA